MRTIEGPITMANVRAVFPAPTSENPFADEPFFQLQSLSLVLALQILRVVPDTPARQTALHELRRAIDSATADLPVPSPEEQQRRFMRTLGPFRVSPDPVVEALLDLAEVTAADTLFDLGSGDGRIVFAAAARGATARGIEIDPQLVRASRVTARRLGLTRQAIVQADALRVDLSTATVVTCYLLTSSMTLLEDKLFRLKPGVRIVSHAFEFPNRVPKATKVVDEHEIFLYEVPA